AGLEFSCDLPDTQTGQDLRESIKRGDVRDMSFAFELGVGDDSFANEEDPEDRSRIVVRTISNFRKLHDVSLVTSPAYPGTQVDARNVVAAEVRSFVENLLKPITKKKRGFKAQLAGMSDAEFIERLERSFDTFEG